jgi:hypothetical protein
MTCKKVKGEKDNWLTKRWSERMLSVWLVGRWDLMCCVMNADKSDRKWSKFFETKVEDGIGRFYWVEDYTVI